MHRRSWIAAALLVIAAACGRGGQEGEDSPVPMDAPPVQLLVANNYALPMEIFAIGSGINFRLGQVNPGMRGQFTLPRALVGGGPTEFLAQPNAGGNGFRSGQLLLSPGAVVELIIQPQLFNSTATLQTLEQNR